MSLSIETMVVGLFKELQKREMRICQKYVVVKVKYKQNNFCGCFG